jgi:hypothetical protein
MNNDPFQPPPPTQFNFLSLGAGVQSSCLALMAAHGEIGPMPDAAIFADTQAEPESVYRWLDWLEKQLPYPVHRVTAGDLSKAGLIMRTTADGRKYARGDIPVFTKRVRDGALGKVRNRACTKDFKILPIIKAQRKLAGIKRGQKDVTVTQWIGISYDEMQRMKVSREKWRQNRWPLVELRMRRHQCLEWMQKNGYPEPPRSSCVFCPFHDNAEWRRLKTDEPGEFARAVEFEKAYQAVKGATEKFHAVPFLHRSCQPLETIDFSTDEERGQGVLDFRDECEGMCGV